MNTYPVINREYSWLNFNNRVFYEVKEKDIPLLEKIKFLSITASNLEEFFMVRVAVLKNQIKAKISDTWAPDSESLSVQLHSISLKVRELMKDQHMLLYENILPELNSNGIKLVLSKDELPLYREELEPFFDSELKAALTPLSIGPTLPFITLVTGRLYLAVGLKPKENTSSLEKSALSFLEIPSNVFGRFYHTSKGRTFIPLENIIRLFINKIYPGYDVESCNVIKITRDADISLQEDDSPDLLKEIETSIKRMHRRSAVRFEYEKGMPGNIVKIISEKNNLLPDDIFPVEGILNHRDLVQIYDRINIESLKFKPVTPLYPNDFKNRNIFSAIREGDIILFHPYHSYSPVVEMLNMAADDPDVIAIKQTLYRTSSSSEIIPALIRAAENGKYVTVIDELKARFDEKRNIEWARKLEEAGAHVTYGVSGLKTHAKALLVIRKEKRGITRYVHLATGNYNENTARLYSDFSLFTADENIAEDISSLFNLITGFSLAEKWNSISIAPVNLRQRFIGFIEREIFNAKKGLKAVIIAKMNSLTDSEVIGKLYEASSAGVSIRLIVRGICSIIPGIPGISANISAVSIIGRYLEHSRIYYFYNNGEEEYYLSSADWMERNLDKRVEILFPVKNAEHCAFLKKIIEIQFLDTANLWELKSDGSYVRRSGSGSGHDSFEEIYRFVKSLESQKDKGKPAKFRPVAREPEE